MQYFKTALDALLGPEWIPINGYKVRICEQLGEGGFAFVYRCEDEHGNGYALKRILCQDEASVKIAEKEIRVLTKFGGGTHPHIVRFYGACKKPTSTGSEFFLLMELCRGGNLVQLLKGPVALQRALPEHRVCAIFKQICFAVQVLHSHQPPLAHRDLKLENVLMTGDGEVKLCDFGSASTRCKVYAKGEMGSEEEAIQKFSTPMYRAPEMVDLYQKWEIGYKADIWALGCILYVLAYLSHPFPDGGNLSIIGGVVPEPAALPPPSPQLSSSPLDIVKKMLVAKPHRRPNIQKVLELVYEWENVLKRGSIEKKSASKETKQSANGEVASPVTHVTSSTEEATQDLADWDPFNQGGEVTLHVESLTNSSSTSTGGSDISYEHENLPKVPNNAAAKEVLPNAEARLAMNNETILDLFENTTEETPERSPLGETSVVSNVVESSSKFDDW